jgi:hypothetical protein
MMEEDNPFAARIPSNFTDSQQPSRPNDEYQIEEKPLSKKKE